MQTLNDTIRQLSDPAHPPALGSDLDRFSKSDLGNLVRQRITDVLSPVKTYVIDPQACTPAVGVHQCRMLLENLLALRSQHRMLFSESTAAQESRDSFQRALDWANNPARVARLQARQVRGTGRVATAAALQKALAGQAGAIGMRVADLYSTQADTQASDITADMALISMSVDPKLQEATPDSLTKNLSGAAFDIGLDPAGVTQKAGAIAIGQKALFIAEQKKSRGSMEDYSGSALISSQGAMLTVIDAQEQLAAAEEAMAADARSTNETQIALNQLDDQAKSFATAFDFRISVILNEYVVCATDLEMRSESLQFSLKRLGIDLTTFSAAALIADTQDDDQLLSNFSIALSEAGMALDDFEAAEIHTAMVAHVTLQKQADTLTASVVIDARNLDSARTEGLCLSADKWSNCVVIYDAPEVVVAIDHAAQKTFRTDTATRRMDGVINAAGPFPLELTGGALTNTVLPLTLKISVAAEGLDTLDVTVRARLGGIAKAGAAAVAAPAPGALDLDVDDLTVPPLTGTRFPTKPKP